MTDKAPQPETNLEVTHDARNQEINKNGGIAVIGDLSNSKLEYHHNKMDWRFVTFVLFLLTFSCVAGWLNLPQIQRFFVAAPSTSNADHIPIPANQTAVLPNATATLTPTLTPAPTPTPITAIEVPSEPTKGLQTHSGEVWGISVSPSGRTIASGGRDGTIQLWRPDVNFKTEMFNDDGRKGVFSLKVKPAVSEVAFSPDGSLLAAAYTDGTVQVYQITDHARILYLEGHTAAVQSISWSADGRSIASSGMDGTIRVWDVNNGAIKHVLRGHTNFILKSSFSPDGTKIASSSIDGSLRIWDAEAGTLLHTMVDKKTSSLGLAWSPDSQFVAQGHGNGTIQVWRVEDGSLAYLLDPNDAGDVISLAWNPNGQILVAASNGKLWFWNVGTQTLLKTIDSRNSIAVTWSPDGRSVVSGSHEGWVLMWDVAYEQ